MEVKQQDIHTKENKIKKFIVKLLVFSFWLLVWDIASRLINQELFLPSPKSVLITTYQLSTTSDFWFSIGNSFVRIVIGFSLGLAVGIFLAIVSYSSKLIKELISPLMRVIKATPVASFIILALVWISSVNLSILISFLMVLPVSFSNMLYGLHSTDEKLLEMARVFHLNRWKCIKAIYLPTVLPFIISAMSVGLGFSFKSGIAAEVIGRPINSIGLNLYEAKLYLMIKELFAWTLVIIVLSIIFEKLVMWVIKRFE